jgi:LPS-assembly protein
MQFYAAIITRLFRFSMPPCAFRRRILSLLLAVVTGTAIPARAATPLCPTLPPVPRAAVSPDTPLRIRADEVSASQAGVSEFSGSVELERGAQRLDADHLAYDRESDRADASGTVHFWDLSGDSFITSDLHLTLGTRVGYTGPGSYALGINHARGEAQRIDFEGPDLTRMSRVSYTNCPAGQDDWFLNVADLKLDHVDDVGTGYNAWLSFKGVPIFYFPYISFPLSSARKSGFLAPNAGWSAKSGFLLATPYYLNLAPNYDDTLTPRWLSRRGLQLQDQFRYLTASSEGTLQVEVLPDDRRYGETRSAGTFQNHSTLSPFWTATLDVRGVSDQQYLEDFGDHLNVTSQTHLPQIGELNYRGPAWLFTARAAAYQTVDPAIPSADRPYARLPQLLLQRNAPLLPNHLNYELDSELVRFQRADSLNGERFDLNPGVSFPLVASYGYFTPRIGARYIGYGLDGDAGNPPATARGVLSLDSGLTFERDIDWLGVNSTQTLEPRLFYLYVPYRNQDALPNFDTSIPDFSFSNLFRDNRFIGGDRIGDANQLTAALTTRFFDGDSGAERLRASVGRIQYFADRRVNIPAATVTDRHSDWAAEAVARLQGYWYASSAVQWNPETTEKSNVYIQYNPDAHRIVNIGQRHLHDQVDQTDISAEWPVRGRWTFRGRSLYSERDRRNVETYAGFQYNACCWAARVLLDRRYSDPGGQGTSVLFELELNGLGKFGAVPDSPLTQSLFTHP